MCNLTYRLSSKLPPTHYAAFYISGYWYNIFFYVEVICVSKYQNQTLELSENKKNDVALTLFSCTLHFERRNFYKEPYIHNSLLFSMNYN